MKINKTILYLLTFSLLCLFSCSQKNLNINELRGKWVDRKNIPEVAFELHYTKMEFRADSFFYSSYNETDYLLNTPCPENRATEFASGKFNVDGSDLFLSGFWTYPDFTTLKSTGCYNTGKFEYSFNCTLFHDTSLFLELKQADKIPPTGIKEKLILYKE